MFFLELLLHYQQTTSSSKYLVFLSRSLQNANNDLSIADLHLVRVDLHSVVTAHLQPAMIQHVTGMLGKCYNDPPGRVLASYPTSSIEASFKDAVDLGSSLTPAQEWYSGLHSCGMFIRWNRLGCSWSQTHRMINKMARKSPSLYTKRCLS